MIGQLFEVITIGLPFCAFKIITGLYFAQYWLVAIGIIDLVINGLNLFSIVFVRKRLLNTCLITIIVDWLKTNRDKDRELYLDLGNALDIFVSFFIVALMIGSGHIAKLPAVNLDIWNICVVLNVLGAGYGRLSQSIKRFKGAP